MQFTKKQKVAAFIGTGAMAVSGAGIAFAAWTSTGTGSGTASSTKESNASTVQAVSNPGDLYPGKVSTILVSVTNNESYAASLNYLPVVSSAAVGTPSCVAGAVSTSALGAANTTTAVAATDATTVIPAGGTKSYSVPVTMINNPSDNCKSQTFTFTWDTAHAAQLFSAVS
jgi:hypothetical protein